MKNPLFKAKVIFAKSTLRVVSPGIAFYDGIIVYDFVPTPTGRGVVSENTGFKKSVPQHIGNYASIIR